MFSCHSDDQSSIASEQALAAGPQLAARPQALCTVFLEMGYRTVKWPQLVVEASMIKMRASEFRRLSHIERERFRECVHVGGGGFGH